MEEREKGGEGEGEEKGNAGLNQHTLGGMGRVPATTWIQRSPPTTPNHPLPQNLVMHKIDVTALAQ